MLNYLYVELNFIDIEEDAKHFGCESRILPESLMHVVTHYCQVQLGVLVNLSVFLSLL